MVSESVLASLLKDDPVALNLEKVDGIIKAASDHVLGLTDSVLSLLADMCDASVSWLRDQVATSVAIQVGYTEAKLREARGLPWCLGRGDVHLNLEGLARQARPCEPVARKIYALMQLQYPMEELVAATKLLLQAGWSTCTEQGHKFASTIIRSHPRYGRGTFTARAMVQQSVMLFRASTMRSKIEAFRRRVRKLRDKRCERISGKHAYCSS